MLAVVALFVVCFLLGSIPWGVIISKTVYHTDIRKHGSGNIGTTNAMRTMGKKGGAAVFVLDFGKGLASGGLSVAAASLLGANPALQAVWAPSPTTLSAVAFLACTWGHIFSPWLKFKGGKGIAVAVGCLFVTFGPMGALLEIAVFAVVVAITRYVSAGSLAAAVTCPVFSAYYFFFATFDPVAWALSLVCALTVIWAHRGNIRRLAAGDERRIGDKKESK